MDITEDDQAVLTSLWLSNHSRVKIELDYDSRLARSSDWQSRRCDFVHKPPKSENAESSPIVCHTGGACPLFLHFNGKDHACHRQVAELLDVGVYAAVEAFGVEADGVASVQRRAANLLPYPKEQICKGGTLLNFKSAEVGRVGAGSQVAAFSNEHVQDADRCANKCILYSECLGFAVTTAAAQEVADVCVLYVAPTSTMTGSGASWAFYALASAVDGTEEASCRSEVTVETK